MSFLIIAILNKRARKQLEQLHRKEEEPEANPFWMENIRGQARPRVYVLVALILSIGAMAADYFVPILLIGSDPWWWTIRPVLTPYRVFSLFLLGFALVMGFLVPWKVYHFFLDDVLQDMMEKAEKSLQPKKIKRTLKMFTLVAGGSSLYQGACIIFTVALFVIIQLFFVFPQWREVAGFTRGFDPTPFLGSWSTLLIYALIGGVVGPMATTISAFTVFCGATFNGEEFFDYLAKDRRGGFGSLGTLGLWSSFMAAATPGVAVPIIFLGLKTTSERSISVGLLFFLIICIVLFFFVPIYCVHRAMKTSRKLQIEKFENTYRTNVNGFLKKARNGKPTKATETLSILAQKSIYDDITLVSDWPVNYIAILEVIASTILPILSYVVKYLFG